MGKKYESILEGLNKARKIDEEVTNSIKSSVKKLFAKSGVKGNVQKSVNDTLNILYKACNSVGENTFVGGNYSYEKGMICDPGDGEAGLIGSDINPSSHKISFDVRLTDKEMIDELYDACVKALNNNKSTLRFSSMTKNGPTCTIYFDGVDNHTWTSVCVGRTNSGVDVEVECCINPMNESVLNEMISPEQVVDMLGKVKSEIKGKNVCVNFGIDKFHKKLIDAGWSYDSRASNSNPGHPVYHKDETTIHLSGNGKKTNIVIDESVEESIDRDKVDKLIKTVKNNIKGLETQISKGQKIGNTIDSVLTMCKSVDKEINTDLYKYYSKELKGLNDKSSGIGERLLDVMRGVLDELIVAKNNVYESEEPIIEAVSTAVTQRVKTLFNKAKIPSDDQKKINDILNQIYKTCNEIGTNEFVGGRYEYIKGDMDDSDYYHPSFNPSVYMASFNIVFKDKKLEVDAFKRLQTEMKSFKGKLYDKYENNYGDIEMIVAGEDNKYFRTYVMISADMNGLEVSVMKSVPLDESALGTEIGLPLDKENCEGTDVSGVDTPTGTLNKEKKIVCPKCGSENVNVRDNDTYYCVECGYSWKPGEESVEEKGCKKRKKVSVKEGAIKDLVIDANDMFHNVSDILYSKDYPTTDAIKKAFKEAGGTVSVKPRSEKYIEYSGKIKGRTIGGAVMADSIKGDLNKLAEDIAYAYFISIGGDGSFREVLPMLKESVIKESAYKVGKRYKTEDGMFFVVKKINKDGSIKVYDEDVEKTYDCELSDLELLNAVPVKES